MPYGIEPEQIVSSFSGAISGDFAVGKIDGYTIINQEIEFQYEKLQMSFSENLSKRLSEVNYEVPSISGGVIVTTGLAAIPGSVEMWEVAMGAQICGPQSFSNCNTCYSLDGFGKITNFTQTSSNTFTLGETIDTDISYIVASYDVDLDSSPLPSLAAIIRDMVCANLGNRLFANIEGGKWSIVEHYETQADKWLKLLESGWMPPELKKMKILFNSGIKSIRMGRG